MSDSFLWDDEADEEEIIVGYQGLIDNGMAWKLEGHVGRTAMSLIEAGKCTLGPVGHRDYWGNYVPSKTEVEPGTKGSPEFVAAHICPECRSGEVIFNYDGHGMAECQDCGWQYLPKVK